MTICCNFKGNNCILMGKQGKTLEAAVGKPKYFIDTEGKKEGERYFWFPNQGDSMTDKTAQSIPSGSLVLGRCLSLENCHDIPLHCPIVLIVDDNGQQFCMLKCAIGITTAGDSEYGTDQVILHSYNPRYNDFTIPFHAILFVFAIERVRLPNGHEFEPS